MLANEEYDLLNEFLSGLEDGNVFISEIQDDITKSFISAENLETAFEIKKKLQYLDYYNANLSFNRISAIVDSYIESNGVEEITTTPGTGFYANEEDRVYFNRVGLSTSPLYDAERITYCGDFRIEHKYGVELNSYYEETPYSYTSYYFRDNHIWFSPKDGECVYSGGYLFCFASDGALIHYAEIDEN